MAAMSMTLPPSAEDTRGEVEVLIKEGKCEGESESESEYVDVDVDEGEPKEAPDEGKPIDLFLLTLSRANNLLTSLLINSGVRPIATECSEIWSNITPRFCLVSPSRWLVRVRSCLVLAWSEVFRAICLP